MSKKDTGHKKRGGHGDSARQEKFRRREEKAEPDYVPLRDDDGMTPLDDQPFDYRSMVEDGRRITGKNKERY